MSTVRTNAILDASGGNTATINSMTPTADSLQGFRNRIINGAMVIDQRNAGASVTPTDGRYTLDRWIARLTAASKYTVQQTTTVPAGFSYSLKVTSSSTYSVGSDDFFEISQRIEGYNIADLGWGTANTKTVTLSFQVYSSLTGTFGGSLRNSDSSRSYPFSYTVSSANTWTPISVTIAGDTSGTWNTTNGIGIQVAFGLGAGSSYSGPANAWAGSVYIQPTGTVSVVGTNGATFYITGVQLEVGSVATPFERRPYGTELMLCQRYYSRLSAASSNTYTAFGSCVYTASGNANGFVKFPNTMRASPTISYGGNVSFGRGITLVNITGVGTVYSGPDSALWQPSGLTGGADKDAGVIMANDSATAFVAFSAEL